jgi:hypothetical protein
MKYENSFLVHTLITRFYVTKDSISSSQKPATRPYPEPDILDV